MDKAMGGGPAHARVGVLPLTLLSQGLNCSILRLLGDGELEERDLFERLGPASTRTYYSHLQELERWGAIARTRHGSPRVHCGLTLVGHELLALRGRCLDLDSKVEANGGVEVESEDFSAALNARGLSAGWATTALRWLAADRCTLAELDTYAPHGVGYNAIRTACEAMSDAGLVERVDHSRPPSYRLTGKAVGAHRPLVAALRWDCCHPAVESRSAELERLDAEALLLMLAPSLAASGDEVDGSCGLTVEGLGGVRLALSPRRAPTWTILDDEACDAWVRGSLDAWLAALADGDAGGLAVFGDQRLAQDLIASLDAPKTILTD